MNVEFSQPIHGDPNGKALFTIACLNEEEPDASTLELWRANDFGHLQGVYIHAHTSNDDSEHDDFIVNQIEENWDILIVPHKIATFK